MHCAAGKSRSATVVVAYLMQKHNINPSEALAQLRQARSFCEPNHGFMKQLELYRDMHTPTNVEESPLYQRWTYQREMELSRACGQAPDTDKICFEDEHAAIDQATSFELRCRKCRRPLATSRYLALHPSPSRNQSSAMEIPPSIASSPSCAHYFVDPLSWMRPELEQGKVEGRLECPKCHTNVGKYAWQGMQCSCGEWSVPGISLSKSRIDQVSKTSHAIRQPPGRLLCPPLSNAHAKENL